MKKIFVADTIVISAIAFASTQDSKPRTHKNSCNVYYPYEDSVPRKKNDTLQNPDTSKPDTMMHR